MDISLDIRKILDLLPHRYPFLLVDRVLSLEAGKNIKAYKSISFNEPFFQGHFPNLPVMPAVLIIEALAQSGALMVLCNMSDEERADKIFMFTGIERAKFRRPVVPGDRLDLECCVIRTKLRLSRMEGRAYVDGQLVAEAQLTAAVLSRSDM